MQTIRQLIVSKSSVDDTSTIRQHLNSTLPLIGTFTEADIITSFETDVTSNIMDVDLESSIEINLNTSLDVDMTEGNELETC